MNLGRHAGRRDSEGKKKKKKNLESLLDFLEKQYFNKMSVYDTVLRDLFHYYYYYLLYSWLFWNGESGLKEETVHK